MDQEESQVKEPQVEEQEAPDLSSFPGAPTVETIASWKQTYGEIICSIFDEEEIFIWKPLTRQEYLSVQTEGAVAQQNQQTFDIESKTVEICLIWASEKGTIAITTKAGSVSTLSEQIMLGSNFLPPAIAMTKAFKL